LSITARFAADFQSFYAAVDQADAKLSDFQAGAGRVESALNRMVDNFSGRKLIQDATLAAEAVERIGGTSKLTEAQLQRLAAQASEAAAKMTAMGVTVPPGIQKIADELKPVHSELSKIEEQALHLGERMVEAFALHEMVRFVGELAEGAKALRNLSLQTGIGVQSLQVLSLATKDYGVDAEQLGRAVFQLGRRIAGGDESAAFAIRMMGMSVSELRGKDPETLVRMIAEGIAKIPDPLQKSVAASDLFGARLGGALIAVSQHLGTTMDALRRTNRVMSEETVEAAAHAADSYDHLVANAKAVATTVAGPLFSALAGSIDQVQKAESRWRFLDNAWKMGIGTAMALAAMQEDAAAAAEKHAAADVHLTNITPHMTAMLDLAKNAAIALTGEQKFYLAQLKEMNELTPKNAELVGVSAAQFKVYEKAMTEATRAVEHLKKAEAEAKRERAAATESLRKYEASIDAEVEQRTATKTEREISQIKKREREEIASLERRAQAEIAILEQGGAATKSLRDQVLVDLKTNTDRVHSETKRALDGVGVEWDTFRAKSVRTLQDLADRELKTFNEMSAHASDFTQGALQAQLDKYRELAASATAMGRDAAAAQDRIKAHTDQATAALLRQKAVQSGQSMQEGALFGDLNSTAKTVRTLDGRMITPAEAKALFDSGGTTSLRELSQAEFERAGGQRRIDELEAYFNLHPGARSGGSGDTGIRREDSQGYARLLQMQTVYQELMLAATKYTSGQPITAPATLSPVALARASSSGPVVQSTVYVSGMFDAATKQQLADLVASEIMTRLKLFGQYPSA
jgi:hypothetical protein